MSILIGDTGSLADAIPLVVVSIPLTLLLIALFLKFEKRLKTRQPQQTNQEDSNNHHSSSLQYPRRYATDVKTDIDPRKWLSKFSQTSIKHLLIMALFYHGLGLGLAAAGVTVIGYFYPPYEDPLISISLFDALAAGPIEETLVFGIPFYASNNHYVVLGIGSLWALAHIMNTETYSFDGLAYGNFLFAIPNIFFSLRTWSSGKGWFAIIVHSAWNGMVFAVSCGAAEMPCVAFDPNPLLLSATTYPLATAIAVEALLLITYLLYYRRRKIETENPPSSAWDAPLLPISNTHSYLATGSGTARQTPSKVWYLLPISLGIIEGLLGIIAGLIAYFSLRKRHVGMAKNALLLGIILFGAKFGISIGLEYSGFTSNLPFDDERGLGSELGILPIVPTEKQVCPLDYNNVATIPLGQISGYGTLYGVAVNDVTNKVYAAHSGNGTIAVIDGSSNALIKIIKLDDNVKDVSGVAVNSVTNKVYAASSYGEKLWVIDGNTDTVIKSIAVGKYAIGVAVDTSLNKVYVASNDANTVSVIDGETDTRIASIYVSSNPRFVAANSVDNKVYVSNLHDSTITVIDGSDNEIITTVKITDNPPTGLWGIAVNPATNKVYVASSGIAVIDGKSNQVLTYISYGTPLGASDLAVNTLSNEIFAGTSITQPGTLAIIDGSNDSIRKLVDVGRVPIGVAVNPATSKVYVANAYDGTLSVIAKTTDCPNNTKS